MSEEIKQSALDMKYLLDIDTMDDEEKTMVKFLVEQLILPSKKVHVSIFVAEIVIRRYENTRRYPISIQSKTISVV